MWCVYPEAIDWNIALSTHILIRESISEVGSQKHFKKWGKLYRFSGDNIFFFKSYFRYTLSKDNLSVQRNIFS